MAYRGVWIYLMNQTQGNLSLTSQKIGTGKWVVNMPTTIAPGQLVVGEASSRSLAVTSCSGSFSYQLPDNQTSLNVNFDIALSGANSGGLTLSGGGASNYSAGEYTSKTYTTPTTFPSSPDFPSVYFKIALANSGSG
jgi:hypothetical protein